MVDFILPKLPDICIFFLCFMPNPNGGLIAFCVMMVHGSAYALTGGITPTICMTASDVCNSNLLNAVYACPSGETKKTCPSGWSLSGSTCSRSATTGSDSTGTYEMTYTSCAATTIQCYESSTTDKVSGGQQLCIKCKVSGGIIG